MSTADLHSQLLENLKKHAERVGEVDETRTGEAETKNFLIEPFLELLGYDCRNQRDVSLEYTADVAGHKGEKVDYVLNRGGKPVILVEAKARGTPFSERTIKQVARYFPHVPSAQIAIFTDGINWLLFKGRNDGVESHLLESRPFLSYKVQEPSKEAVEWLICVSKPDFDVSRLLSVARRLEFTDRVYDWIQKTLITPNHSGAAVLNSFGEIGATEEEIPLLMDAVDIAMRRIMTEHAPLREFPDPHVAGDNPESGAQKPASDQIQTFSYRSHTDNELCLDDGSALTASSGTKGGWRIGDRDWQVEASATAVSTFVLAELLRCDARRDDPDALASEFRLKRGQSLDLSKYRLIPGYSDLYYNKANSTPLKAQLLERVASKLQFDPPTDSTLYREPRIEWWLP